MRSITLSAVLLLAFASTAAAQSGDAREGCTASLERLLAGTAAPDWYGHRCDRMVLADVTRRVRAAAQVADSARLERLAFAAAWFRDPDLFRAALTVARDRRAAAGARRLGLHIAFGQMQPWLMVTVHEPAPPPPPQCGPDSAGRWTCVVSVRPECGIGIAKRAGFAVDRPIPARLQRELESLIHFIRDDGRAPHGLRRLAQCILEAQQVARDTGIQGS